MNDGRATLRARPRSTCNRFDAEATLQSGSTSGLAFWSRKTEARALTVIALLVLVVACGADETPQPTPVDPERTEAPTPDREAEAEAETESDADFRCERDDECVVSRDECTNLVGVRRDRVTDYEQRIRVLSRTVNCAGIGEIAVWGEHVAFCREQHCRAADSGRRCTSTDECMKIEGACGMYDVVHRDFETPVREHFNRLASVSSCPAGRHAPELRVECREGVCVGDVIPDE